MFPKHPLLFLLPLLALTSALPSTPQSLQPRDEDPKTHPPLVGLTLYTEPDRRGTHFTMITNNNSCYAIPDSPTEPARILMTAAKSLRATMYSSCPSANTCEEADPPIKRGEPGAIVQCTLYNNKDCTYTFSGSGQFQPDRCLIQHTGPMIDVVGAERRDDGRDLSSCLRNAKRPGCRKEEELCGMEQIRSWRCVTKFMTFGIPPK